MDGVSVDLAAIATELDRLYWRCQQAGQWTLAAAVRTALDATMAARSIDDGVPARIVNGYLGLTVRDR